MLGKQALTVTPERKEGQQYIRNEKPRERFRSICLDTHRQWKKYASVNSSCFPCILDTNSFSKKVHLNMYCSTFHISQRITVV